MSGNSWNQNILNVLTWTVWLTKSSKFPEEEETDRRFIFRWAISRKFTLTDPLATRIVVDFSRNSTIEALETTTLKTELSSLTRMAPLSNTTPPSLASDISISLTKSGKDFTIRDFPWHLRSRNPHLQISHELTELMVRVLVLLLSQKPGWNKIQANSRAKLIMTLIPMVWYPMEGSKGRGRTPKGPGNTIYNN